MLEGSSWVKNETVRSASWSTQNAVLAGPPGRSRPPSRPPCPAPVDEDSEAQAEADPAERGLGEQRAAQVRVDALEALGVQADLGRVHLDRELVH